MAPEHLNYGEDSFKEIARLVRESYHEDYTLSLYNALTENTMEVNCRPEQIAEVVEKVSSVEHDFPLWFGVNELTRSYVVGLQFTCGVYQAPSWYDYIDGELRPNLHSDVLLKLFNEMRASGLRRFYG